MPLRLQARRSSISHTDVRLYNLRVITPRTRVCVTTCKAMVRPQYHEEMIRTIVSR